MNQDTNSKDSISNEEFFHSYSFDNKRFIQKCRKTDSVVIYLTRFDPKSINDDILIGNSIRLIHHNICIRVFFEPQDKETKNWAELKEQCYCPFIKIGTNKSNTLVQFAPCSEFKLIKHYTEKLDNKELQVYHYMLCAKNNRFMIQNFELSLKSNISTLLKFLENKQISYLILFNSSNNLIEIYLWLLLFLKDQNISQNQLQIIYNTILNKLDTFLNDSQFDFYINVLFFNNVISILGLEKEISNLNLKLEDFNFLDYLESILKELEKKENYTSNTLYIFLLKLVKRLKIKLDQDTNIINYTKFKELFSRITEMQIKHKQKIKMIKEMMERARSGKISSLQEIFIGFQNLYGENVFTKLMKLYLVVKSYLSTNNDSSLSLLKKIEELTIFTFEHFIQIFSLKKNIFIFFHELLIINFTNKFTDNSFIIGILIIFYSMKDESERDDQETYTKKEAIYSFAFRYIILMIEMNDESYEDGIINQIKFYGDLRIYLEDITKIIERCRKKDFNFFETSNKKLTTISNHKIHYKDLPLNDKNNNKIIFKLISSSPNLENSKLSSMDLIICNDDSVYNTIQKYQNCNITDVIDDFEKLQSFNPQVLNYLTKGLTKDKIQTLSELLKLKDKTQEQRIKLDKILIQLKSCFPDDKTFLHFIRKYK